MRHITISKWTIDKELLDERANADFIRDWREQAKRLQDQMFLAACYGYTHRALCV